MKDAPIYIRKKLSLKTRNIMRRICKKRKIEYGELVEEMVVVYLKTVDKNSY